MLRKTLVLSLLALMTLALAPVAQSQEGETVRLRMHAYPGGAPHNLAQTAMIDEYNERGTGIEILRSASNLYSSPVPLRNLERNITGDDPPDLFTGFVGGGALQNYIEEGYIAPITDLWEDEGWFELYPDSVIEMMRYQGEMYFVPMGVQWHPVFYRADIMAEEGLAIPATWDELLSLCTTLDERGYRPFTVSTLGWNPPAARWFSILNLRLNGLEFHESLMRGEISFEDQRVRNVFEHWGAALDAGCFGESGYGTNYGGAVAELVNGQAVMYFLGEWLSEGINAEDWAKLDFFRFPLIDEDVPPAEIAHYYGAYMHTATEHPEAARQVLAWLGGPEAQTQIATEVGRLVMSSAIDRSILPAYQMEGLAFINESGPGTPLFEVSAFDNRLATLGLSQFVSFLRDWNEEGQLDITLQALEAARQESLE